MISNCWAEAKLANRRTAHADVSSANFLNTVPLPVRVDLWNGPARLMTLYGAAAYGSPATIRVLGIGCSGYQIRDDSRGQKLFLAAEGVSKRSPDSKHVVGTVIPIVRRAIVTLNVVVVSLRADKQMFPGIEADPGAKVLHEVIGAVEAATARQALLVGPSVGAADASHKVGT